MSLSKNQSEKRIAVRAGLFVALALTIFALVVLLIGKERRYFDPQVSYHAAFDNVDGLKRDSPVWLGGLEVGRVVSITFSPDLGDKRIQVHIEVSSRFSDRIRADSVARLASRGVLGDKAVDVSLGSAGAPKTPPGGELKTGSSGDLSSLLKASGEIVDNAVQISRDLKRATSEYTDPQMRKDLASFIHSASGVMGAVEHGDGTLHALIYDASTKNDLRGLIANASKTAKRVDHAIDQVDAILTDVRDGQGALHALVYDKKGAKAVEELGSAANELAGLIHDAKESQNGAVHQLVYGDARGMFADLGTAAADLKRITNAIAEGQGSLGAIIKDPTVYDDLRSILGNVKRNRVLRALVRWSISNNDETLDKVGQPQQPVEAKDQTRK
jgi:phospholipid/cholesterol/gamma-HCH transport system substrate-binding protein